MVTKIYKSLTQEQKENGVIFSSCLSVCRNEQKNDKIHEVLNSDIDKWKQIENLQNDKFFSGKDCPYKYNIIRR